MKISEQKFRQMLEAYASGNATKEEKELLDEFFESYRKEAQSDDLQPLDLSLVENRLKSKIHQRIDPSRVRRLNPYPLAIAASIALAIVVSYILFFSENTSAPTAQPEIAQVEKVTTKGQKLTFTLPDGSRVKLNANSKLTFSENYSAKTREVALQGEAYFEVTSNPSTPFVVRTNNATTTVLGTSFNVRSREETETRVTLVEGRVSVGLLDSATAPVVLVPNQQAILLSASPSVKTTPVDVLQFIEWKDNILRFDNTPMNEAAELLEDWYGVEIFFKNTSLKGCKITGRYEKESLENVLNSFAFMLKAEYTLEEKQVTISGKGCNGNL